MNYLIYPTKVINITQTHLEGNHASHSSGEPKDYPIDDGSADAGRSYFYCPCDEMKIVKIYGVGSSGVNTVWMTSTAPVDMPAGSAYVTVMVEHPEDDDLLKLKVGQIFKRGEAMFREGGNGANGAGTYGNHFHISVGTGQIVGTGWRQNSKGAWVIHTTGEAKKATDCFYLDGQTIRSTGGLNFRNQPKEVRPLDNTPNAYAESAVKWALEQGILKGDDKGDYRLHDNISRQDLLVMLYRALNK